MKIIIVLRKFWQSVKAFFTSNVLWGIIIMLACISTIIFLTICPLSNPMVKDILVPILSAIVSGFIVSFVIDIRKQVTGVQELIVNSFTENTFLQHLSEEQIIKLRKDALEQLTKTKYPGMQKDLVEKDREIFHALTNPYYDSFRETSVYYKNKRFSWDPNQGEGPVLFKNVDLQYTIKSPHSESTPTTVDLSICKALLFPVSAGDDDSNIKRIWNIKQMSVVIDNNQEIIITDDLAYDVNVLSDIDDYYNKSVRTFYKGTHDLIKGQNSDRNGIFLTFKQSVRVHINYDINLPVEDNHYTSRLKYPAKSFSITCLCNDDPNVKFYGELLGTFMESSELKITHPADNILTIEASNWLLPKNGVVIMLCEKQS